VVVNKVKLENVDLNSNFIREPPTHLNPLASPGSGTTFLILKGLRINWRKWSVWQRVGRVAARGTAERRFLNSAILGQSGEYFY
jgi:hypothetical protein